MPAEDVVQAVWFFFSLQVVCCNLKDTGKNVNISQLGAGGKNPWKFNIVAEHFLFFPLADILRLPERNSLYFSTFAAIETRDWKSWE